MQRSDLTEHVVACAQMAHFQSVLCASNSMLRMTDKFRTSRRREFCQCALTKVAALVVADALPVVQRTFGTSDMLSLWIGLVVCLPSWYLAGSLVEMGAA